MPSSQRSFKASETLLGIETYANIEDAKQALLQSL